MQINRKLRVILITIIVLSTSAFDQISKTIVRNNLEATETIHIIKGTIILEKVENAGAALGVGTNLPSDLKTIYFQILPIAFLIFLFRMIIVKPHIDKITTIGIAFSIGGGFGNILDRIFYGSVTDFLSINIGSVKTSIFNLADVFVILGIALVFLDIGFRWKKTKNSDL